MPSATFRIRSLAAGSALVENVLGSVAPVNGPLILGQSFLARFRSWSIDNVMHALVLGPKRPEPDTGNVAGTVGIDIQDDKVLTIVRMSKDYLFVAQIREAPQVVRRCNELPSVGMDFVPGPHKEGLATQAPFIRQILPSCARYLSRL